MNFQKMLTDLIPVLGQVGVDKLAKEFQEIGSGLDKPWKQAAMMLLADAVSAHGMDGIRLAQKAIEDLFDNKVPAIDWANPRTASDLVAKLQNAEADDKSAARDFFVKVGVTFGQLFAGMVKGLATN